MRLKSYITTCNRLKIVKKQIPFKERFLLSLDSYTNTAIIMVVPILILANLTIYVRYIYLIIGLLTLLLIGFKLIQQLFYYKALKIKEKHLVINNVVISTFIIILVAIVAAMIVRLFI